MKLVKGCPNSISLLPRRHIPTILRRSPTALFQSSISYPTALAAGFFLRLRQMPFRGDIPLLKAAARPSRLSERRPRATLSLFSPRATNQSVVRRPRCSISRTAGDVEFQTSFWCSTQDLLRCPFAIDSCRESQSRHGSDSAFCPMSSSEPTGMYEDSAILYIVAQNSVQLGITQPLPRLGQALSVLKTRRVG